MEDCTFKAGEIALFQNMNGSFGHLNGEECEVLKTLAFRPVVDLYGTGSFEFTYEVNYRGLVAAVPPENLKKKPGKRQSRTEELRTVVPWNTVGWNPHQQPVEA